jgi:hypothetical protein
MDYGRPSIDDLLAAVQESRDRAPRLSDRVQTLVAVAEPLGLVMAKLSLGGDPPLLSVRVTGPAEDVDGTGILRAAASVSPELRGAEGRQELYVAIEARNGADELVGDILFVYGADTGTERASLRTP